MNNKHKKLWAKLVSDPKPRQFKWDDLISLLNGLGYKIENKTGSSAFRFVLGNKSFGLHRPHPGNTLKPYAVEIVRKNVKEDFPKL